MIFYNNIEFSDYVKSLTDDDLWDVYEDDSEATIRLVHPDYGQFDIVLSMDTTFVLHTVDNDIKVFYHEVWGDDSVELSVLKAVKVVVLL